MANPVNIQAPLPTGNLPSVEWSQLGQGVPGPPKRGVPQLGHVLLSVVPRCGPNDVPSPLDEAGEEGVRALYPELLSNGLKPCANTVCRFVSKRQMMLIIKIVKTFVFIFFILAPPTPRGGLLTHHNVHFVALSPQLGGGWGGLFI